MLLIHTFYLSTTENNTKCLQDYAKESFINNSNNKLKWMSQSNAWHHNVTTTSQSDVVLTTQSLNNMENIHETLACI